MNFIKACTALPLVFFLLAGCGGTETDRGALGVLSGKVTFDGEAVTEGMIQLNHTTKGFGGAGVITADGAYLVTTSLGGLPIGEYQVSVIPPMVLQDLGPDTPKSEAPKEMPNIPKKYRTPTTSGMVATIEEGDNTFDILMKKQ